MTPKHLALALCGAGGLLASVGIALIYLPAALIASGCALVVYGFLAVDVDEGK